jgi:hypothetical protein
MAQSRSPKDTTAVPEVMSEKEIARSLGAQSVEVRQNIPAYDNTKLVNLESWEDLGALFSETGVELSFADKVLGDGFTILDTKDKASLIGKPMALLEWRFNESATGRFVSIRAVVKVGKSNGDIRKVIINDGSTGILQQLDSFTKQTGKQAGLIVQRGLRVSSYMYEDKESGVQRPAETYYLDASADD